MTSLWLSRITLAVAVVASIATSQMPNTWSKSADTYADPLVLNAQTTSARYGIHTEIMGEGPFTTFDGSFHALVTLRSTGAPETLVPVRITVRSVTNPDQQDVADVMVSGTIEQWVDLPAAWAHCALPPCAEDLELQIELLAPSSAPAIDTTIWFQASGSGDNYDLQQTTHVTLQASRL